MSRPVHQLYPSPLRYPGGKGKLANYIKLILVENGLVGAEYAEPYAGGASVALFLLFEEYASHIHINDVNRSVSTFWKVVVEQPEILCERVEKARLTVAEWDRQRVVQRAKDPDPVDLAFSTLFMNRTNRSGIISGGIIGGRNQTGKWKIDARFRKADLIQRIEKIARFRSRITVTSLDGEEYLTRQAPKLPKTFFYLDPPYYSKGKRLYEDFYSHSDHSRIAKSVKGLQQPWIVSYDSRPEIEQLYEWAPKVSYSLNYTARERVRGCEVMFFGESLKVPGEKQPERVSMGMLDEARVLG